MRGLFRNARERNPLALAARERHAALAHYGRVAIGEGHNEVVRLGLARGLLDLLLGGIRRAKGNVLAKCA